MINYKLRLFTPRSSYGAKEMAPKSQLCACSFQDSLRQKNWALEQIRKFPDTIGYMWTAENDSNTLRVDAKIFASANNYLRKKKISGYVWTWPKKQLQNDTDTLTPFALLCPIVIIFDFLFFFFFFFCSCCLL